MSNYKKLLDVLKQASTELGVTTQYVVKRNQNLNIQDNIKAALIAVVNTQWTTSVLLDTTRFNESYNVQLRFYEKDELSSNEDKKNNIVASMHLLSKKFIVALANSDDIMNIGSVVTTPLYNQLDQNYTGVGLSITLELFDNGVYC